MIDQAHERPKNAAKRTFFEHQHRFIEGEDFFRVPVSEKSEFRTFGITIPNNGMIVLTEVGYLMIVKSFNDDLAWRVQRELVKSYFRKPISTNGGVLNEVVMEELRALRAEMDIIRPLIVDRLTRKPKKACKRLTPELLSTMRIMYIEGVKQKEIVERTGSSAAAVNWAVRCVKEEMEKNGGKTH